MKRAKLSTGGARTLRSTPITEPLDICERALLGGLLIAGTRGESDDLLFAAEQTGLTEADFTDRLNGQIFTIFVFMRDDGRPIDPITVGNQAALRKLSYSDEVVARVQELVADDQFSTPSHVPYYAREIAHAAKMRRIGVRAQAIAQDINEGNVDAEQIRQLIHEQILTELEPESITVHQVAELADVKLSQWRAAREQGIVGLPSSLPSLNRHIGGYRAGVMTILGGYRNEGKSGFIRQELLHWAGMGIPCVDISLEETAEQAGAMMAAAQAGVSSFSLDTGRATEDQFLHITDVWHKMRDLPLYLTNASMNIGQIGAVLRMLKARHQIKAAVIDHMHYIRSDRRFNSRNDEVGHYSAEVTAFARELDIVLIAVCQLSREAEKGQRRPRLSDLRDSGSLEQDARLVLMLFRQDDHHLIHVAKSNNGPTGGEVHVNRMDGRHCFEEREQGLGMDLDDDLA